MDITDIFLAILLVFYLYLLIHKEHVREPGLFRLGLLGYVVMFIGACFGLGGLIRTRLIFQWIGSLWALFGVVAACAGFRGPYDSSYRPEGWGAPKKQDDPPEKKS